LRRTLGCAAALAALAMLPGCQTPNMAKGTAGDQHAEIVLREGDVIRITFPGTPNLDTADQAIRRDGKITLPIVGEVAAADLTPTQLKNALIGLFANQLLTKEVDVTVVTSNFSVFVDGSVNRPGKVVADHPLTAFEAIMEAGGFDYTKANMRKVMIIRRKPGSAGYDYIYIDLKVILDGQKTDLFYLAPGDILHVPEKFSWF
jgi:protein involved in polysaccharide export with SLBB domain